MRRIPILGTKDLKLTVSFQQRTELRLRFRVIFGEQALTRLDVVVELGEQPKGRSGRFSRRLRGLFFLLRLFYGDINIAREGGELINVER